MDLLQVALEYAQAGYHVFPCHPRTKIPATPNGLLNATTDEKIIRQWWTGQSDRNIAIRTGKISNLVVLDVDGEAGEQSLHELQDANGLDATYTVITGRGLQLYFTAPEEELRNRAAILPGLDFRAEGGYVIAPPSIHETGHIYTPLDGERSIIEMPTWLIELVKHKEPVTTNSDRSAEGAEGATTIGEGGRNAYLTKVAGRLQRSNLLTFETLNVINERDCDPPLPEREVQTIFNSISRYSPSDPVIPGEQRPSAEGARERRLLLPPSEISHGMVTALKDKGTVYGEPTGFPGLDKILGGGLRPKELVFLSAIGKSGKTTLTVQIIHEYLKREIPCAFASAEMDVAEEILPSIASLAFEENVWKREITDKKEKAYIEYVNKLPVYFVEDAGIMAVEEVQKWVRDGKEKGVQFFFSDHLHLMVENAEDFKEISKYTRAIKRIAREEKVTIFLIVQPKEENGMGIGGVRLRGGSALYQNADVIITMERYQPNEEIKNMAKLKLERARHKLSRQGSSIYLQYNPDTCGFIEVKPAEVPDMGPVYGRFGG